MKKLLCFIIIFTLLASGLTYAEESKGYISPEKVIEIPDKNLEEVVRNIINKKTGTILYKDIMGINSIFAPNKNISSIKGLEYFENLISINLSYNNIEDFSPISKLLKLSYVNIEGNSNTEIDVSIFNGQSKLKLYCNKRIYNFPVKALNNSNGISNINLKSYQENTNDIDYLILLDNNSLLDSIKNFYDFKKSQGLNPWVELVQNIPKKNKNRTDDIRDYLIDLDKKYDLEYVLFIGEPYNQYNVCADNTGGEIPMKYIYSRYDEELMYFNGESIVYSTSRGYYTNVVNVPSDLFYAYDIEWDHDKDGYAGEFADYGYNIENNSKMIDLSEPLFLLGRIPFSEKSTVENILNNTIKSQKKYFNNYLYNHSALLAHAYLGFVDADWKDKTKNINYMDMSYEGEIVKKNLLNLGFNVTNLYEKEGMKQSDFDCTLPLNLKNFMTEFIKGYDIVISKGHSSVSRVILDKDINKDGFYDKEDETRSEIFFDFSYGNNIAIKNAQNTFAFLDACVTGITEGKPSKENTIQITSLMENGAIVSGVGTTRDTLFSPNCDFEGLSIFFMDDLTEGSYAYHFYKALGKKTEQYVKTHIGLSDIIFDIFSFNFFGDPSLNCFLTPIFADVPVGYIHESSIKWAYDNKIVEGYQNKFNPEQSLTEAQFAVMLTRYGNIQVEKSNNSSHYSDDYYKILKTFNLPFEGYTDLNIKNTPINRGKIAKIIASLFGLEYDVDDAIMFMYKNNFSNGMSSKEKTIETYGKDLTLTRSAAVAFLHRMSTATQVVDLEGNIINVTPRQIIGINNNSVLGQ